MAKTSIQHYDLSVDFVLREEYSTWNIKQKVLIPLVGKKSEVVHVKIFMSIMFGIRGYPCSQKNFKRSHIRPIREAISLLHYKLFGVSWAWCKVALHVVSTNIWASSLSHRRPVKAQASLRIRAVSPEPSRFAYMKNGSRRRVRPNLKHLAPLNGCACAFEEWIYGGRKVP